MSILYATIDSTTLGSQLELKDGGLILTYNTTGTDRYRNARADIALSAGKHYWEVVVYGNETITLDNAVIGILANTGIPNTYPPGEYDESYGYFCGGSIWEHATELASVAAYPLRAVIGVALNIDDLELSYYVNGLLVYTSTLLADYQWIPAFSISGDVAYGFSMFVNFGSRDFEYAPPEGFRRGVFETTQPFSTVRIASEDWLTPVTSETPNLMYDGTILNGLNFNISKEIAFWPFGSKTQSVKLASLRVENDGRYDHMVVRPPKDARVNIKRVDRYNPTAEPVLVGTALIDDVESVELNEIDIKLKDFTGLLELPISKKYYLPYVADGSVNRLLPISLGAVRNMEPQLTDDVNRTYTIHDSPLTYVAAVRDKGDKLDPLAAPPDWVVMHNQQGIELETKPEGKLSADVSSSGQSLIVGSPDIDILSGTGNFGIENGLTGLPENFYLSNNQFHSAVSWVAQKTYFETSGIIPSQVSVTWDFRYKNLTQEQFEWCTIKKGCYYRLTYSITSSYWPNRFGFGQFAAGWQVRGVSGQVQTTGQMTALQPGTYTVDFRATCDGTLAYYGSGNLDPANMGGSTGPWWLYLDDVTCVLKSAEVVDVLDGYGNFISGITFWVNGSNSGGSSAYGTINTTDYTGIGAIVFTITSGAGNKAERYCNYAPMVLGEKYRIGFNMRGSSTNAKIEVYAFDIGATAYYLLGTFTGAGENCECFAQVGTDCQLLFRAKSTDNLATTVKVSQVRLSNITDQANENSANVELEGITLSEYMKNILETRSGLGSASWSTDDIEAIEAATGYPFGVHVKEAMTRRAMVAAPLDSFTASYYPDAEGKLRFPRLIDPAIVDDEDVVLIVNESNSPGAPKIKADKATGLTQRWGARRNWELHGDSDFVEDDDPVTGIDLATRTRFKRVSQYIVTSAKNLDSNYIHAKNANEFDSLLDIADHAQLEIDRVCELYAVPRSFYTITVYVDEPDPNIVPGAVLKYTRKDNRLVGADGKKLLIVVCTDYPISKAYELICWG